MTGNRRHPGFDSDDFLTNYWQKKPLLIKQFYPDFEDPISAEELAGFALEEVVESRLVSNYPDQGWQLRHGPLSEADLLATPEADWTLLVQAMDQWHEPVNELLADFRFLPSWRIDDIMISYATPGGGVGPHFDYYDVFLLQGSGQRRWRLGQCCDTSTPTVEQAGQAILPEFSTSAEYVLQPGDVLYVPAGLAHWGECVASGLCYSVGFRAPSEADMLAGVSDLLIDSSDPAARYTDSQELLRMAHGGEIPPQATAQWQQTLQERLQDPRWLQQWFGMAVSKPRYPDLIERQEPPWQYADLNSAAGEQALLHHPASRLAFTSAGEEVWLFVDGECYALPASEKGLAQALCQPDRQSFNDILPTLQSPGSRNLLLTLFNNGTLYLAD